MKRKEGQDTLHVLEVIIGIKFISRYSFKRFLKFLKEPSLICHGSLL